MGFLDRIFGKVKKESTSSDIQRIKLDENTYIQLWQIRLEELEQESGFKPIIIESFDKKDDYFLRHPERSILYSPGIHWVKLPEQKNIEIDLKPPKDEKVISFIEKIKPERINEIEKLFKHDLASEFGAIFFAKELFKRNYLSQNGFEEVVSIVKDTINNEKRKELRNYFLLKDPFNEMPEITKDDKYKRIKHFDMNVLFIDDRFENGWQRIFGELFDKEGETLVDDTEVEDLIKELKEDGISHIPYDVIILDLNLLNENADIPIKERSGYKALKMIRNYDMMIPVIMLTGSERSVNMKALEDYGIEAYIPKLHPGMSENDIQTHIDNFLTILAQVKSNLYLHDMWKAYKFLKTNLEETKINKLSVLAKLKAALLKFHSRTYEGSEYKSKLQSYEFNEVLLYLHSILSDILQSKLDIYEMYDKNSKQYSSWGDSYSKPGFGNKWINEKNYSIKNERMFLDNMNYIRNKMKPIHGNKVITKPEAVFYFLLVIVELIKDIDCSKSSILITKLDNLFAVGKIFIKKQEYKGTELLSIAKKFLQSK
ncbi:MAG: response regulator [Candidatus Delongbacteria bacterium]|jgi:CheY-like chemotaxis protein|nr:response regulator [Candidatus Delongbacteria bacterium]